MKTVYVEGAKCRERTRKERLSIYTGREQKPTRPDKYKDHRRNNRKEI